MDCKSWHVMMWLSLLWEGWIISVEVLSEWKSVLLGKLIFSSKSKGPRAENNFSSLWYMSPVECKGSVRTSWNISWFAVPKLQTQFSTRAKQTGERLMVSLRKGISDTRKFLLWKVQHKTLKSPVLLKSGLFHGPLRVFASSIACASLLGCAGITTQQAESVWGSCSGFRLCRTPSDGCHKSAFQSAPILQPKPSGQTIGLGNRGRGQFTKSKFT